jgi:small subunit ribosomal protein S20
MPNTKSAERRMRSNERKHLHNRSIISALRKSEKGLRGSLTEGKKADAVKTLPDVLSALDKAVKSRVITRANANRKKSRLTLAVNRAK